MSIVSIQIDYTFLAIITITKNKFYIMKTNFIYIGSFNKYLKSITDLLTNWKLCIISLCIIFFLFL